MATYYGSGVDSVLGYLQKKERQAYLSNLSRKQQISSIWDEVISRYQPGGTFEARTLEQLGAQKERDVTKEYGSTAQSMISRGLFGTTVMPSRGEVGRKWERDIGAPSRLQLEDILMQRLSSAQIGKAGFLENIQEPYPDYGMIASLAAQASNTPRAVGGYGSSKSPGQLDWVQQASQRMAASGTGGSQGGGTNWSASNAAAQAEQEKRTQALTDMWRNQITNEQKSGSELTAEQKEKSLAWIAESAYNPIQEAISPGSFAMSTYGGNGQWVDIGGGHSYYVQNGMATRLKAGGSIKTLKEPQPWTA